MRWIFFNIILLASLLSVSGSSTTRSKRDVKALKEMLFSFLPGAKTPSVINLFRIKGRNDILLKVVPKVTIKNEINKTEEILPTVTNTPPVIDMVASYLGTKNPEETLKVLDGVKNLLQSGILEAKKEEITLDIKDATMESAVEAASSIPLRNILQKGDEIVFIDSNLQAIRPAPQIVFKPGELVFQKGFLVAKPYHQIVETIPTKLVSPASQYFYHQINNEGIIYSKFKPGNILPNPPKLQGFTRPLLVDSGYITMPQFVPDPENLSDSVVNIEESLDITNESSSSYTNRNPEVILPEPPALPSFNILSQINEENTYLHSQMENKPVVNIPEPPSLTEYIVPSEIDYDEATSPLIIFPHSKPAQALNVNEMPNQFSYTYVAQNGQKITFKGSKYNFSLSEPTYHHSFPISIHPIVPPPERQPYYFSNGAATSLNFPLPNTLISSSTLQETASDKESEATIKKSAPLSRPYSFSYGIGMSPDLRPPSAPSATQAVEHALQVDHVEDFVEVPSLTPIAQPYAFSYGNGLSPPLLPPNPTLFTPYPVPFVLPVPLDENVDYPQMCGQCGALPPHILTRVQRLTNNIPTGQVFGVNPYAVYQPEQSMENQVRGVPYVNNGQNYEIEFPEKEAKESEISEEEAASNVDINLSYNKETDQDKSEVYDQEESVSSSSEFSENMPIVVSDEPTYDYLQSNADGSLINIKGHKDDHVSVDIETSPTEINSMNLGEIVY